MSGDVERIDPVVNISIQHVKQRYNWDCGITCVLMVLPRAKQKYFLNNLSQICKEEEFNKSTWTIDLSYLLKRFNIDHIYCTITLGVCAGYKGQNFYDRILHKDEQRVVRRFQEAQSNGIVVKKVSLSTSDLLRHIYNHGPIIVLVNANFLLCDTCSLYKLSFELQRCLPWRIPFHGHYIILCGYSLAERKVLYRNPSHRNRLCSMSLTALSKARKSYGTDEDTILIFMDPPCRNVDRNSTAV